MNLLEYQAKKIFDQYGIEIPKGFLINKVSDLELAYHSLEANKIMLKVQAPLGGRGKRGWIQRVSSLSEAKKGYQKLRNLHRHGQRIGGVLLEEAIDIQQELYLAITIDSNKRRPVLLFSLKGGVDVETLVEEYPNLLGQFCIDPFLGLREYQVRGILCKLNRADLVSPIFITAKKLFQIFWETDAVLAEINPLALTMDNKLVALDAKISLDENAIFRHPEIKKEFDKIFSHDLESRLKRDYSIEFVDLKGEIGIVSGGAGMTMTTMDMVLKHGANPACFMDASAKITPEVLEAAIRTVAEKEEVRSILFNMFGGLTRMDEVAKDLVEALERIDQFGKPLVIRLQGTNADKAREILSAHGKINFESLEEAIAEAVRLGEHNEYSDQ
jgi:succinyl-CoA synthetase beta subunit